jgi:hypothetical protein
MPDGEDTLHEVTEVAVIHHRDLGVLLLHSEERRWHFPDATVRVGEPWDESLRVAVHSSTGIPDLAVGQVVLIQNFGPGEVDERPQFGIFFRCSTDASDEVVKAPHRWIRERDELAGLELFHPLVADLIGWVLDDPAASSAVGRST